MGVDNGPVLRPSGYEPVGLHLSWVLTTVLAIRRCRSRVYLRDAVARERVVRSCVFEGWGTR